MAHKILNTVFIIFIVGFTNLLHARELPDFTSLVEKNSSAVVNISTRMEKTNIGGMPPGHGLPDIPKDSPFYDFYKK